MMGILAIYLWISCRFTLPCRYPAGLFYGIRSTKIVRDQADRVCIVPQ